MQIVFRVRRTPAGWTVEDGSQFGPFVDKAQALDLAEGMADAIRKTGGDARVQVDEG